MRGQSKEALFITEPASKKVILGESIRLNCKISGIPKEEQESSVQWTQNTFALGLPPLMPLANLGLFTSLLLLGLLDLVINALFLEAV